MAVKPDNRVRLDPVPDKFKTDLEVWRFLNQLRDRVGGNSGNLIYDTVQDANTAAALEPLVFSVNAAVQSDLEGQVRAIIEQLQEQTIDDSGILTSPANVIPDAEQPDDYISIGGIIQQAIASAPVQSVFGRVGNVVALEGDYSLDLLSDVTLTAPIANQVLSYNGAGWVNSGVAASALTGVVDVVNGGTGASSLTANNVILGNGTSPVAFVAPGTSGNVLTSNGTTWTSAPPTGGGGVTVIRETITVPANTVGEYTTSVVSASALPSSKVQARLVLNTELDQNGYDELNNMDVFAVPGTGTILFTLTKQVGNFVGPFYIDYFLA